MTERGLWNVEQIELEYRIRQLCKSAEISELDGKEVSKFPIFDVSYYVSHLVEDDWLERCGWLEKYKYSAVDASPSPLYNLSHPLVFLRPRDNYDATVKVFKKNDLWLAQMDIKCVKDQIHHIDVDSVFPLEALAPNIHTIIDCNPGGMFGHIYTIDNKGSSWSIHVHKPINVQAETPVEELGVQGMLIKV
ncbi:MAG: hypothetical protein A3C22_00340 [Candidatus Levybacteria bacterium RIFCSPHIGHO2_02_FULL_37_10]|nr:MAG: hypothetical protein A3C22_00340 [Candidatus Levybacteria bacterium RIFCSPHIGHO2_02_FULL_37_10]OGH41425.1 MAG: hypothetical protein A3H79_00500 [Candidatus Levybacteria bacterium RIFCSPLOWO2_02_FULL_36_8b]